MYKRQVIEGDTEKQSGLVQIKDLIWGSQIALDATLEEWKENPAQSESLRSDLVKAVSAILKSQN